MSLQATEEVIWSCTNKGFCSSKSRILTETFCRSPYNITGLCRRSACPLANDEYATVREIEGKLYLLMKTPERKQFPAKLWEHILIPANKKEAKHLIRSKLQYHTVYVQENVMRRYIRILQVHGNIRKLKRRKESAPTVAAVIRSRERKLNKKEFKAEKAAQLEDSIKKTLLERLKSGQYEGIVNFPQKTFEKVLQKEGAIEDTLEEEEKYEIEYEGNNIHSHQMMNTSNTQEIKKDTNKRKSKEDPNWDKYTEDNDDIEDAANGMDIDLDSEYYEEDEEDEDDDEDS
ncbi:MAG: putative protein MAK16 [Streblomastix strix]|uniref:Ribosomal eL28/Mak16 domain-containing protein n=1 Tax=Streblomastix strix TaxID=222440 RepID=A0A5J4WNF3_9EUKA|nr:MAG: putative protein MAK16 [Streblomastix strix]